MFSIVQKLPQVAVLFIHLANVTSIINVASINDTKNMFLKIYWLQILYTLNIMKLLENIAKIK